MIRLDDIADTPHDGVGPPGNSPSVQAYAAATIWSAISPTVKFRVRPA